MRQLLIAIALISFVSIACDDAKKAEPTTTPAPSDKPAADKPAADKPAVV